MFINTKNMFVIGDSITKGVYLDNLKISKIEKPFINNLVENYGFKIENKSVFGQTLKRFYEKDLDNFLEGINFSKQNICLISLGGNDCDYCWNEVENNPQDFHGPKTDKGEFLNLLMLTLEKLKAKNVIPILCSLCPIDSNRYFNNVLSKKYDGQKILNFLNGDIENLYRHQEVFNNAIQKIAFQTGTLFFDYRTEFLSRIDFLSLMCEDGIHPNQNGHNFITKLFENFLYSIRNNLLCGIVSTHKLLQEAKLN